MATGSEGVSSSQELKPSSWKHLSPGKNMIVPRILLAPEYVGCFAYSQELDLPILGPFLPFPGTRCRPGSPFAIPGIENFCLEAFKLPEINFTIPRNRLPIPRIEGMCLGIIQCHAVYKFTNLLARFKRFQPLPSRYRGNH